MLLHAQSSTESFVPVGNSELLAEWNVALLLTSKVLADELRQSLTSMLSSFPTFTGRLVAQDAGYSIHCNNAGLSFLSAKEAGSPPSFASPLADWLFDRLSDFVPVDERTTATGALVRCKLTEFDDDESVLAFSVCRAVGDVSSLGDFLRSWSDAHQGFDASKETQAKKKPADAIESDEVSEEVEEWRHLCPTSGASVAVSVDAVMAWVRSKEDLETLRQKFQGTGPGLSVEELLVSEVLLAHQFQGSTVKLDILRSCRKFIGEDIVLYLNMEVSNSISCGQDVHILLQHSRSKSFLSWRMGIQNHACGQLVLDSWLHDFPLSRISFGKEKVEDIALGLPMIQGLVASHSGRRHFSWLLPQRFGCFKLVSTVNSNVGNAFVAQDQEADCLSVANCARLA